MLTAFALIAVVVLDGNFADNLSRAIADKPLPLNLNPWEAGIGAAFAVAIAIALWQERKR